MSFPGSWQYVSRSERRAQERQDLAQTAGAIRPLLAQDPPDVEQANLTLNAPQVSGAMQDYSQALSQGAALAASGQDPTLADQRRTQGWDNAGKPQAQAPPKTPGGGSFWGELKDVVGKAAALPSALVETGKDIATGAGWGEVGGDVARLPGAGLESLMSPFSAAEHIGFPIAGALLGSTQLSNGGKGGGSPWKTITSGDILHPGRLEEGFRQEVSRQAWPVQIAAQTAANPLSFVGGGAESLAARGSRALLPEATPKIAQELISMAVNVGTPKTLIGTQLAAGAAQRGAEKLGVTNPTALGLTGLAAGFVTGAALNTSIKATPEGKAVQLVGKTFLAPDQSRALLHALKLHHGLTEEPLTPQESALLAPLAQNLAQAPAGGGTSLYGQEKGYQGSFAEAIGGKAPVTGVPIESMKGGILPAGATGLGSKPVVSNGLAEYLHPGSGVEGGPGARIYTNDVLLSQPGNEINNLAQIERLVPHEEGHDLWLTGFVPEDVRSAVMDKLFGPVNTEGGAKLRATVRQDVISRWKMSSDYSTYDAQQSIANEAWGEAWASLASGQTDTPYAALLGQQVRDVVKLLTPEQRQALDTQRSLIMDWTRESTALAKRNGWEASPNPDVLPPAGAMARQAASPIDIDSLRTHLAALADQGEGARYWYENSGHAFLRASGDDIPQATRMAIVAAFSSNRQGVDQQGTTIARGMAQLAAGEPVKIGMGHQDNRINQLISLYNDNPNAFADEVAKGIQNPKGKPGPSEPKVGQFFTDLVDNIDPALADRIRSQLPDRGGATHDLWMARAFGYPTDDITAAQRDFMNSETRRLADSKGWTIKQAQASMWTAVKAQDLVTGGGPDVLSPYHYGDALAQHVTQVSWEAAPGTDTHTHISDTLAGFDKLAPNEKAEYLYRIATGAMVDGFGHDLLAHALGMPVLGEFEGAAVYTPPAREAGPEGPARPRGETQVGLGRQTEVPVPRGKGAKATTVSLDEAGSALVNKYAALKAWILGQDAIGWTRIFPNARASEKNGHLLTIGAGRAITTDEAAALSAQLANTGDFVLLPHAQGAIVFRELDDADRAARSFPDKSSQVDEVRARNDLARKQIEEAANIAFPADPVKADPIATDGGYVYGREGQELYNASRGSDGGPGSLTPAQREAVDQLRSRVNQTATDFADEYGLGPYAARGRHPDARITRIQQSPVELVAALNQAIEQRSAMPFNTGKVAPEDVAGRQFVPNSGDGDPAAQAALAAYNAARERLIDSRAEADTRKLAALWSTYLDVRRSALAQPMLDQRLWTHATKSLDFDVPDPDKAVGQQTAISQGPGIYLAADPQHSEGFGDRTFVVAADKDAKALNLNAPPAAEDVATWRAVAGDIAQRIRSSGLRGKSAAGEKAATSLETLAANARPRGFGTNFEFRDSMEEVLRPYARDIHLTNPAYKTLVGERWGTADMSKASANRGRSPVAMAAINDALGNAGIDALFYDNPNAQGEVLVGINGDKFHVLSDSPMRGEAEAGKPWSEIRDDIAKNSRPPEYHTGPGENGWLAVLNGRDKWPQGFVRALDDGKWEASHSPGTSSSGSGLWAVLGTFNTREEAMGQFYGTRDDSSPTHIYSQAPADPKAQLAALLASKLEPPPGGEQAPPTFLRMQPHEMAQVLGLDPQMVKLLDGLDQRWAAGALSKDEMASRTAAAQRLEQEYRAANPGKAPVWAVAPGSRESLAAADTARQQRMTEAGMTPEQIGSVVRNGLPGGHTLRDYVGGPNYDRMLGMESIASNTSADDATRQGAREALRRENGVIDAPAPSEDQLPAHSPMAPALSEDAATKLGLTGGTPDAPRGISLRRPATAMETAIDVANIPRSLVLTGHLAAPFRQGLFFAVSHPTEWAGAFNDMLQSLKSQQASDDQLQLIRADPDYQLATKTGLFISDISGTAGNREEAVMSRFVKKIPLVAATARAHTDFLNALRWDTWKTLADQWRDKGITDEASWRRMASYVNIGTGRGDLKGLADLGPILNAAFFSPRNLAAKVQLPGYMLSKDPAIRSMAVKDMAKFIGAGSVVLSLAALAGAQVELDPRSSDFGKIKVGDTRYDFWAGWTPLARYVAQLTTGQSKSVATGEVSDANRLGTSGRFLQSKLSPLGGLVVNSLRGETPTGADTFEASPSSVSANALALVTPIFLQDVADAIKTQGAAGGLMATPSAIGVGYSRYGGTAGGLDDLAKQVAAQQPQRYPEGAQSFWDLEPADRNVIKAQHPDAYKRYTDAATGDRKAAELVRTSVEQRQSGVDQGLVSGSLTLDQWQKLSDDLKKEQLYRLQQVYVNAAPRVAKTPLDRYYQAVSQAKDPQTGAPDWNKVDEWVAQQPQTDQDYIQRNTGLSGSPLQQLARATSQHYYSIPLYPGYSASQGSEISRVVTSVQSYSAAKTDVARLAAVNTVAGQLGINDASVLSGARRVIIGQLKPTLQRQQFAKQHPEVALVNGRGLPSPQELSAIVGRAQQYA